MFCSGLRTVARFCKWLENREERFITLVGHSSFIGTLIGTFSRVENCSPIFIKIGPKGVEILSEKTFESQKNLLQSNK